MRHKIAAIIIVLATVTMLSGCPSQQELAFRSIQGKTHSAITPVSRTGEWWAGRHDAINERLKKGNVGLLFIGDSITHGWENAGKEIWAMYYAPRNAVNMGISGDRTQHVLWRLDHSHFENVSPQLAVILIGVNNSGDNTAEEITEGTIAICRRLRTRLPKMKILLLAIFPTKSESRNQKRARASLLASRVADGKMIHYLDINPHFLTAKQELIEGVMRDGVHPNENGYRLWAEAIESKATELIGDAIIYFAASRGDMAKIEALVRKGIDVNAADAQGGTALHYAAQEGHKDVVKFLLSQGADGNARDNDGRTPLDVALSHRRNDVIKLLVEAGADIPTIHIAAFVGSLDKLQSFVQAGTDVDAKDENGRTPLLRAISGRHIEAVGFLIEAGADVNKRDEQGYVPLMHALWTLDSDMVQLLLNNKADVHAKDTSGYTPLHWAVMMGSKELTEFVLEAGGDVNAQSRTGETPLDLARQGGSEIVELLWKQTVRSESSRLSPDGAGGLDEIYDLVLTGPSESRTQYGNYPRFGDVNGDGYEDLLVAGASRYNHNQGRIDLYYGGANMDDVADMILTGKNSGDDYETGENPGDYFGEEAYLADVNGDQYADIITGAAGFNKMRGRVYIYFGGPTMDGEADLIIEGEVGTQGGFGGMITAGDVNNDGYADVVVDAMLFRSKTGRTYLYYGGDPFDTTADLIFDGEKEGDRFGRDINNPKMIGDVNGDGYGDLLLSSRKAGHVSIMVGQARPWMRSRRRSLPGRTGGMTLVFQRVSLTLTMMVSGMLS
ncbi:MAG: ankyrin repeat domain-containing protein [Planctomycetota bacterium]|jgi:beta-glucosidase